MRTLRRKEVYVCGLATLTTISLLSGCSPNGFYQGESGAGKTITWMVPEDPLIDKYASTVADAFEKQHPGVTVKVLTPGSTGYGQKLLTLIASGETPDIFTDWGNTGVYTLVAHNVIANLTPYFKEEHISPNYIPLTYRKEFSQNGKLFAIPWNSNPEFLVYNKTLFQKYHVPLPPTNWDDKSWNLSTLLKDAKLLTHDTENPSKSTWGVILSPGTIGTFGWLWGADPLNSHTGPQGSTAYQGAPITDTYATRDGMVKGMTWLSDLTNKWHVSPSQGEINALSTLGNPFFSGKIGMVEVAGGWLERQAAVAKPQFQWGIAPFPYGPAGVDTTQREDNAFYLSQKSAHPKLAFQFMLFATKGWGAEQLIELAKDNPPHTGTKYFDEWLSGVMKIPGLSMNRAEFSSVFLGGIQKDFPDPGNLLNNPLDYANPFTQLMSPVWIGKESPTTGLKSVQKAWQHLSYLNS